MALESTIRELSDGLKSVRVTERKKNAESLKDFLTRNALPSLLTTNTLNKRGYSWSDLFDDVNEYIFKETEKYETSKTFESAIKPLCTSLLHLVVAGSNKGHAYVSCDKITEACIFILKDKRLKKAIGDAYLNLLYKHVLPCEYYLGFITLSTWEDLLDVCLSSCISNYSELDAFTMLRLILIVMKNGISYCQLIIPLRDGLAKWKRCLYKVILDKKAQEVVIDIMIMLLETLTAECRLTLCHFMESTLSQILKCYDQNLDYKKKSSLFHLLQLCVTLHHPQGRPRGLAGSVADDWSTWNRQLHSILEVICLEVVYLQRIRKLTDDVLQNISHFYQLAAAVYFQIFSLKESEDNEPGNSSKKSKISFNKNKTFTDLIDELRQNHLPWLGIIHNFVKNNNSEMSIIDYIALIKVIEGLVTNSTINLEIFEELTCLVLNNLKLRSECRIEECDIVIVSLWNTLVRNSTTLNLSHNSIHNIMQYLLNLDLLKHQQAQSLFKFYIDKGMPVTGCSTATLCTLFHKFFSKYSYNEVRNDCVAWFIQGDVLTVNIETIKNVLMRLLSKENLPLTSRKYSEENNLLSILFDNEKSVLYSEFELDVKSDNIDEGTASNALELNIDVERVISEYLLQTLMSSINKFESKKLELEEFMKTIHLVIMFIDIMLKSTKYTQKEVTKDKMFQSLKTAILLMYSEIELFLKKDGNVTTKIKIAKALKDIFLMHIGDFLSYEVRSLVHKDFFMTLNKIIITEKETDDDDVVYAVDEKEVNLTTLKHACVLLLAAYCRKKVNFRHELLNFILDPKIHDFSKDELCLFQCLDLLNDTGSDDPPSELMFTLLQYMCKDLYRNPKSSYKILTHLKNMLEKIWSSEGTMKQNCLIMIRSYVQRCEKMHYPPIVAALIYECVAKIVCLNQKHSFSTEDVFSDALVRKVKGNVHRLRIYCCYLMKTLDISEEESENFLKDILEIFVVNISDNQEYVIKDELANRTLTVLHCYLSIAETKRALFQKLVTNILQIQKEKKLNECLVKKVLKKLATIVGVDDFEAYVNKNVVSILYFWFLERHNIDDLPVHLMGYVDMDAFLERHKKWVVSADILWRKDGDLRNCDYANQMMGDTEQSVQTLIEECFCQIMSLCLPYLVTDKYHLCYLGSETYSAFKNSTANAKKMFQLAGEILENEKWTNLFVENVGELVLLNATYLCDRNDARLMFEIDIPEQTKIYCYPKNVFTSILNFFGDLNDGSIIKYLCEDQPLAIFQVLFALWKTVLDEKVLELKVLAVHAFNTFLEIIPLNQESDAFVCNFACNSYTRSIEICSDRRELSVLTKAVKITLENMMPTKADLLRNTLSHLLTTLVKKKREYDNECKVLFDYLMDMKHYLNHSADVVDFVSSLSQGAADIDCSTLASFTDKLKTHKTGINCPSPEILSSLRQLLSNNKHYLRILYETMSPKGFSEDCGSSIIHQIVHLLSNILKCNRDEKIIMEACNCLSEIGTYDLRTLVTVPPINTQKIVDVHPKQYFTCVVVKTLSDVMFDDPAATKCVVETLNDVLKYKEGLDALGLEQVNRDILKSLTSNSGNNYLDVRISNQNFSQYCVENFDGIFLRAMTQFGIPNDDENAKEWLKAVTTALLRIVVSGTNYFSSLLEVCALWPNVCQKILPPLVGLILQCSSEKYTEALSRHINMFFNHIWEQTFDERFETRDFSQVNMRMNSILDVGHKMVIQYMLDVVDFIRLQKSYYKARPERTVEAYNYLRLEYDKVAWAATVADQNLAAIYYGELWTMSRNDGVPPSGPEATTNVLGGENIQQIFRQCYVSIGEMDAIDGCGTAHLTIDTEKRKHLINTGQYADALLLHDIAASCGSQLDPELQLGTVRSLHKSGMHHLAMQYIKSLPESNYLNDIKYECLSFLGDWTEIIDTKDLEEKAKSSNCYPESILKAYHYSCLKDCLNFEITPEYENKLALTLNKAKMVAAKLCQEMNMENCQSVYKVLSKLHLFTDIEDYFLVRSYTMSAQELLSKWDMDKLPKFNDFRHLESMISQRTLMLEHAATSCNKLRDDIVALQIQYAKLGLSNNRVQMAQRLLAFVKKTKSSEEVALVESEISWAKGHKEIALSLLRNIVSHESDNVQLTASSMRQFALWMAESKRDNARDIINKYLLKSLKVLQKRDHVETRLKVYHDIAKFADTEYKQVVSYMNSSIFENKVKVMESLRGTASSLRSTQHSLTRDERKALFTNERFKELDEVEIENTKAEKESFLNLAMRYYLFSLKQCEENNLSVFRVISLWLDNPSFAFDDAEQSFETVLHSIPSRKFITVLPQLAPRLTNEETPFAENLRKIIIRCAIEHPHHTLPILFALKNSDKDKQILNASGAVGAVGAAGGGTPREPRAQEPRVAAAGGLLARLAAAGGDMAAIVAQMETICDATISFANYKPIAKDSRQKIPSAEQIKNLRNLDSIPIPTVTIPMNNDCKYKHFPTLLSFDSHFELVGGINCPKKVSCLDSTGNKRILLIKGEDDMRQDAVMQQVFTIVNTLLDNNPVTSRNKLLIRTYKVVPMSKQSGVLEWCVGTIPLGVYLVAPPTAPATNGAHARYRPQDMSCHMARKLLNDDHKAGKSNRDKLATFTKILREFKPVFHYFFTEHYLDPVTWYERRLAYTKSVATSSMVGYILGLGDRHVQNILVDKGTAEVVHIDFGIAFDQGKTLHTPETVPFRLTQDMIAGFGSSGVEGIFRRCCEKTMQLLRDNSETLLTILEVLLCDPLYSWTVTTNQQNTTGNRNTTMQGVCVSNSGLAERALLAVSSKLSGTEGGAAGGVAVRGQVARLLHAAADPGYLCRLYPGWQPYL